MKKLKNLQSAHCFWMVSPQIIIVFVHGLQDAGGGGACLPVHLLKLILSSELTKESFLEVLLAHLVRD